MRSEVLGLELGVEPIDEHLRLRFYDVTTGEPLPTPMERMEAEMMSRQLAEERAKREAEARRALEEELRRLQAELKRLKGGGA